MVNKVQLIGNVGTDPDIRSLQNGNNFATIKLVTTERWKDKNTGEKKEQSEWHNVVVYGPLSNVVRDYVEKGTKLYVGGSLKTRKWQDKNGQDRYTTEVVLSGPGSDFEILSPNKSSGNFRSSGSSNSKQNNQSEFDDEIPF